VPERSGAKAVNLPAGGRNGFCTFVGSCALY